MAAVPNVCAGPFGAFYEFYVVRPWMMRLVGRVLWGMDASLLYANMAPLSQAPDGSVVLDVPSGGGVALRALRPQQKLRYLAGDISERQLARIGRRAKARSLQQVELVAADMTALPFRDGEADLFLSYSGLHMLQSAEPAIHEIARCLKPGGRVVGTTFIAEGSRRSRAIFYLGSRRGHPVPPARADLRRWLVAAGLIDVEVGQGPTFVAFSARKPES
jgi:ubiquinone/menaquinone biosynthesis C-methylase UbiE